MGEHATSNLKWFVAIKIITNEGVQQASLAFRQ